MQTIGERLEEARKRKGISIREAAEATKIRGDYLHKYENNQFDIKLPEIYVRGFLRTYAIYLKLSGEKIINDYHALGLGDAAKNGRSLNREVYGRMDISVATAKAGTVAEAPSPASPSHTGADVVPSDKNPATFRPRAPGGFSLDPNLILKAGALLCGAIILVLLLIWGIVALTGDRPSADDVTWVKAQPGDHVLNLAAITSVPLVTVTEKPTGTVLYRGPLKAGESRPLPYNQGMTIVCETPQSLQVEVGGNGKFWRLANSPTEIKAP